MSSPVFANLRGPVARKPTRIGIVDLYRFTEIGQVLGAPMIEQDGILNTFKISMRGAAVALVLFILNVDATFGQPSTQPQPSQHPVSTQQPAAIAPAQYSPAAPIKEIKESKETKEILVHPSDWVGVTNALAWPGAVVLTVFILIVGIVTSRRIRKVFGLTRIIREFKAGGIVMKIDLDVVKEVETHLRDSFNELVADAEVHYQQMASLQRISQHLGKVILHALPEVLRRHGLEIDPATVRGTVHVPDIIFSEHLYQLVDYFPGGGGADRRFPEGFGIIGRSWRLGESMGRGIAVPPGPDGLRELIEHWGMSYTDAITQSRRSPADLCIILKSESDGQLPVGLLYIDSTAENAFGKNAEEGEDSVVANDIARKLEIHCDTKALASAISRGMPPLLMAAPRIDITGAAT